MKKNKGKRIKRVQTDRLGEINAAAVAAIGSQCSRLSLWFLNTKHLPPFPAASAWECKDETMFSAAGRRVPPAEPDVLQTPSQDGRVPSRTRPGLWSGPAGLIAPNQEEGEAGNVF